MLDCVWNFRCLNCSGIYTSDKLFQKEAFVHNNALGSFNYRKKDLPAPFQDTPQIQVPIIHNFCF